jgi:beta-lactamase class A
MPEAYNQVMLPLTIVAFLAQGAAVSSTSTLEARLRQMITASGAEVAVAYETLDGRARVSISPDVTFHAASTMKVPVMIELYRQAKIGKLSLDDRLPVKNAFRSIVDGSAYSLSETDDSDRKVYAAVGSTMALGDLCEAMITVSSNLATNLLIEKLEVENVRATVTRLHADRAGGMQVMRGVEDGKAFEKGLNNTTTASGLATLLMALARGQAVDAASDAAMIEILKRQKFNDGIPAGLPPGTPVAHKTGDITRINHDAGIVDGPRPFVLVVLVRGIEDKKQSHKLIADLSRIVFESATRQ